jgi:predicted metal-dependent peptidase
MTEIEQITENSGERLKNLIAKFVLKYNYWGYLFSRIRRRPATGFGSIMGVGPEPDGTVTLYYEPYLVSKTDDKYILKILEHEGMHLLNQHISRFIRMLSNDVGTHTAEAKKDCWNIAADCAVNVQAKILENMIVDGKPWPPCLPKKYDLEEDKATENYYYDLLKKVQYVYFSFDGNKAFDNHKTWDKNISGVADLSSLSRKLEQQMRKLIKDSVKHFSKNRGNLPSHIAELIEQALGSPKAPYYQIIRKLVRGSRLSKFLKSPTRINRKRTYTFHLAETSLPQISPFPGKKRDMTFDIVVLIDTSGSMGVEDIAEGLSGVKNIIENDRHCYTTVLEVDAGVEKEYQVKKIRDIQFQVKGRGGTVLRPGLERARELQCDICLAFSDGFVDDINSVPRKYLPKKLVWIITKNGSIDHVNRSGFVIQL